MASKLRAYKGDQCAGYLFDCPACGHSHFYLTTASDKYRAEFRMSSGRDVPIWNFNNNLDKPTFTPSLSNKFCGCTGNIYCHLYITNGKITYCGDSDHPMAGKTVEMI